MTNSSDPEISPTLYIFLDEGGNFDFSPIGSKYFTLTSVSKYRPFTLHTELDTYKYDLIEHRIKPRIEMEYFHCAQDNRFVRSVVFEKLSRSIPPNSVDAVIVEKSKTGPALRAIERFYPEMLGYLCIRPVKVQGSLAYEPVSAAHRPLLTTHRYPNEV